MVGKGPKNSGKALPPPPLFGQCPKENIFFWEVFPKKHPSKKLVVIFLGKEWMEASAPVLFNVVFATALLLLLDSHF